LLLVFHPVLLVFQPTFASDTIDYLVASASAEMTLLAIGTYRTPTYICANFSPGPSLGNTFFNYFSPCSLSVFQRF